MSACFALVNQTTWAPPTLYPPVVVWYYAFHYHDCRTSKVSSWSLIFFSSWTLTSTKTLIHPLQSWPQVLHKLDIINFSSLKWDLSCGWKQNRILIFLITNRSNIQGNLMKYDNVWQTLRVTKGPQVASSSHCRRISSIPPECRPWCCCVAMRYSKSINECKPNMKTI